MRILLKRIFAIWLLGLGTVCLIAPFPLHHNESRTRDIVRFNRLGIIDSSASRATGLLSGAVAVEPEDLAPYPTLRQALEQRLPRESLPGEEQEPASHFAAEVIAVQMAEEIEREFGIFTRIPGDEAKGFLAAVSPADWAAFRLIYSGHLFGLHSFEAGFLQQITDVELRAAAEVSRMPLSFRITGPNPLLAAGVAPELRPKVVASWPAGKKALEGNRPSWSSRDESPALRKDWNERLMSARLAGLEDNRFVYQGRLFEAEPLRDQYSEEIPHPKLLLALRIFGLVALVLGIFAGRGLYASSEEWGTRTSTTGPLVAADAVVLLFATLSFIPCLDFLLSKTFGTVPLMADEMLLTVSGAGLLVVAVPLCALVVTAQGLQRVEVDTRGVEVRGLAGRERVAWSDVRALEVREIHIPMQRAGILMMRRLMKTLAIDTDGSTLTIQEPPFKKGKRALLDQLDEHAPEELKEQIAVARKQWTSLW